MCIIKQLFASFKILMCSPFFLSSFDFYFFFLYIYFEFVDELYTIR